MSRRRNHHRDDRGFKSGRHRLHKAEAWRHNPKNRHASVHKDEARMAQRAVAAAILEREP